VENLRDAHCTAAHAMPQAAQMLESQSAGWAISAAVRRSLRMGPSLATAQQGDEGRPGNRAATSERKQMNVEPGRNSLPSVTRLTANDLRHEIVAGLFDLLAPHIHQPPDDNFNQTKPCSPRSP